MHGQGPHFPPPSAAQVAERQKTYMKLLAKFNRLVNRCEKEGLTWHRELDPKEPGGKKKKKAAAAAAAPAAAGAAAAVGPAQ